VLAMLGLLTVVWATLAALGQPEIRRLLAYSAIAHAGFLAMAAGSGTAGRQAAILNRLVEDLVHMRGMQEQRLRELLGHTPVEVVVGALLGFRGWPGGGGVGDLRMAVVLVPGVDVTPDRQAIADYAAVFYVPAPRTIFRGIKALEPGTLLEAQLDRAGELEIQKRPYFRWSVTPRLDLTLEEAVDEADGLVEDAVGRQLESDVPLGALLSGGIDSSLVSAAAQQGLDTLQTFNVRFADAEYDETPAARAVADHIGSQHETLAMGDSGGSWDHVTSLLSQAGQPFADSSLFAVDAVAQAMRRRVTVALSGDGGDRGIRRLRLLQAARGN